MPRTKAKQGAAAGSLHQELSVLKDAALVCGRAHFTIPEAERKQLGDRNFRNSDDGTALSDAAFRNWPPG